MSDLFRKASELLEQGSFSATGELLGENFDHQIIEWHKSGLFDGKEALLAEAFTCASFLNQEKTVSYLLAEGLDPNGGNKTGLNALHWAANRGGASTVKLLLEKRADPEFVNMYGGTVLGQVLWSALNEPRDGQTEAIEALIEAGAEIESGIIKHWNDINAEPTRIRLTIAKALENREINSMQKSVEGE